MSTVCNNPELSFRFALSNNAFPLDTCTSPYLPRLFNALSAVALLKTSHTSSELAPVFWKCTVAVCGSPGSMFEKAKSMLSAPDPPDGVTLIEPMFPLIVPWCVSVK